MLKIPLKMLYQAFTTYRYKVTPKRLINIAKVGFSIAASRLLRRPIVWGYPLMLMVEPTNICNLKCPMCPSGNGTLTRSRGKMKLENFKHVIDEIGEYLVLILFWNQGEPFINRSFIDMIALAKAKGIPTMTSTNGHYLRTVEEAEAIIKSGLDEIIVSLDGTDQETYEKYRVGGKFKTVMDGIELLIQRKNELKSRRPIIHLQFLVFKHNQQQIDQVTEIGRKIKVDRLSLKSAQVYTKEQAEAYLPDDDKYRRYENTGRGHKMKLKPQNWCKVIWYSSVLNWDGMAAPCCFDKDGDYAYGNAFNEHGYKLLWTGREIQSFRRQILKDRAGMDICGNCFEGMKQSYAHFIQVGK